MDDLTEVELVYITIAPNKEKVMNTFRNEEILSSWTFAGRQEYDCKL